MGTISMYSPKATSPPDDLLYFVFNEGRFFYRHKIFKWSSKKNPNFANFLPHKQQNVEIKTVHIFPERYLIFSISLHKPQTFCPPWAPKTLQPVCFVRLRIAAPPSPLTESLAYPSANPGATPVHVGCHRSHNGVIKYPIQFRCMLRVLTNSCFNIFFSFGREKFMC